jgi:uncharacterized protein involved in type VI secretion and phage assembly
MHEPDLERLYEMAASRMFGKYRGIVTSNDDDDHRGRLEVQVNAVFGTQKVWALPCAPFANPNGSGFFAMPDVGANVWVEFEAGNLNFPIWSGCFWPEKSISSSDGVADVKFWKTKNFTIRIDDNSGELTIEKSDGGKLKVSSSEVSSEADSVTQTSGGNKTKLSSASFDVLDGALTVV